MRNKEKKQPVRCFTHADIVQFFNERYKRSLYGTYKLKKVELLPELTPPTWQIEYRVIYDDSYSCTDFCTMLVLQKQGYEGPYLNGTAPVELPAGLISVQEEDAEIKRQQEAEETAWRKKWEAERQGGQ